MSSISETQDTPDDEFQDELKPGATLLRDQYVIEQFLNNGGFGITYLAKDSLHRRVVIKECFPEAICGRTNATVRVKTRTQAETFRTIVDLFIAEARNIARLSHPNIVSVHQVFEDNDTAYFAMDFVDGHDLLEIIEGPDFIQPDVLERMVVKLLDALEFIHRAGIVHCDIAPDNILLNDSNEPVLIDFGAARDTATTDSRYLGAVRTVKDGYSPQEFYVADAQQYPSSDIYSLAASLYHVMTKELPQNAQKRMLALASGEEDPYVSIKGRVTGFSDQFLEAIDYALNVFPQNRFQSAEEWRDVIIKTMDPNTLSGPTLAVDNGSVVQTFDDPDEFDDTLESDTATRESRQNSVSPESTFAEDAAVIAGTVKQAPGNGLYLGVATAALLAVFCAGAYFLTGGDDAAQTEIPVADAPTFTPATPAIESSASNAPKTDALGNVALFQKPSSGDTVFVPNASGSAASNEQVARPAAVDTSNATASNTLDLQSTNATAVDSLGAAHIVSENSVDFGVTSNFTDPALVATVEGPAAEYLEPGMRILAVNGTPITAISDVKQIIMDTSNLTIGEPVQVSLSVQSQDTGESSDLALVLPTLQETTLSNGVNFHTVMNGDTWQTTAASAAGRNQSELQAGDRIVALMPDNAMIDTKDALEAALEGGIENGTTQFSFAVEREGDMWFVTMDFDTNS